MSTVKNTSHLVRFYLNPKVWNKLKSFAETESQKSHVRVSASDLIRAAIHDWVSVQEQSVRLGAVLTRTSEKRNEAPGKEPREDDLLEEEVD